MGARRRWEPSDDDESQATTIRKFLPIEQKHVLLSALSVGVGVGVGLGLTSGQMISKWIGYYSSGKGVTVEQIEEELLRLVIDGRENKVTFDEFPYFLSERTQVLLTSSAYVHLKHLDVSKHTRNLLPASRAILLSGPAELYQQMLARALAHHFDAKLLLLDVTDFSLKMLGKYGSAKRDLENFIVPPGVEGWILKSIGKKWRNFKASLKDKHYDPRQPVEILLARKPSRVLEDPWRRLLTHLPKLRMNH